MKNISLFILSILACSIESSAFQKPDSACLSGAINSLNDGDTVVLYVNKYGDFYADKGLNATYITTIKNGGYKFSISSKFPVYFSLVFSKRDLNLNLNSYFIETGDNISINR